MRNSGRHYYGNLGPDLDNVSVELNVGADDRGFTMEIWGASPGIFSVDMLSPGGEYILESQRVYRFPGLFLLFSKKQLYI